MILENKVAVVYGAGGGIGGAVARAFAREGAKVFLTGHHLGRNRPSPSLPYIDSSLVYSGIGNGLPHFVGRWTDLYPLALRA